MDKKKYEEPILEVILFEAEDVMTESATPLITTDIELTGDEN